MDALETVGGEVSGGASPARQARKKQLMGGGVEHTAKSIIQASLDVAQLEQEMVLARENHRELNRGLLELWVNQVRTCFGGG